MPKKIQGRDKFNKDLEEKEKMNTKVCSHEYQKTG
jgi:hypothetical protein